MNDEKNEVIDNSNENSDIEELNVSNNSELENSTINQENVMGSDDNTKKPKEKKNGRKVLILIIIILLIALCVGGYFLYKNANNKTKKIDTPKSTTKSEYRLSGNSLENFDLYFLQLENTKENKIYSPLSIKYALAMLQEGAKGETKEQITNLIGDYKPKAYTNSEHMSFANAMFIRNTFKDKVKEEYTKNLQEKYNAEVILDEFASPDNINNWVSNKTFNLVNNLLDDVSGNNFFLINALAIDMNWNNQIHCAFGHTIPCLNSGRYHVSYLHEKLDEDSTTNYSKTDYPYDSDDKFYGHYSKDGYVKNKFNGVEGVKGAEVFADFNKYDIVKDLGEDKIKEIIKPEYEKWLNTDDGKNDPPFDQFIGVFIQELKDNYGQNAVSTDFLVSEDDNVKAFAKDLQEYDGTTLQYVGIMPKNVELSEFVEKTNKDKINDIIKNLKVVNIDNAEEGYVTRIKGFIPFFKYDYELKLIEDLQSLGVNNVFDINKSDLSSMISEKKQYINKAIHKANIEFSNDGIKAAAATAMGGAGAATGPHFEHLFKVPVKDIDLTFDKPYMYIIRDKATGEVWFTGTVYSPITQ